MIDDDYKTLGTNIINCTMSFLSLLYNRFKKLGMNQNKNNFCSQQTKVKKFKKNGKGNQRRKKQNVRTDHTNMKTERHTDSFAN